METDRSYIRKVRYAVQLIFLALTLNIGYKFYQFVLHFKEPGHPFVPRPESVDAFLPISGLMSLKFSLFTGIIEPFHPAAHAVKTALPFSMWSRRK